MNEIFAIATGVLFAIGVFLLLRRDLIKVAMGFYVLFTAINLFFLAAGAFNASQPPYVQPIIAESVGQAIPRGQSSDPLVQALILTAIVISFGSYALLLGLINVASRRFRTLNNDEVNQLQA